jgi:hypothetical protein
MTRLDLEVCVLLNSEVKEDMKVWLSFLESFNGKAYFPESEWSDNETLELYTDSASCPKYYVVL